MGKYKPLSREELLARKQCCGHRCLNCPYVPRHVKHSTQTAPGTNHDSHTK